MSKDALIELKDVGVDFPVYNAASQSLKNRLLSSVTGGAIDREHDGVVVVRGLQEINLKISAGERVGLIGHNGAGKTTMLRVLSGIYHPTHGKATIQGECVSLIDISLGIDPEATGRENIRLRSAMLGFTPEQTRQHMDEIIEFSGLGDFIDMPFRTYSSGMQLRLAFAVSTTVNPQILIMDEWLSTGDENFRERAEQRMRRVVDGTDILILASHTRTLLQTNCDRIIWLEHGRIRMDDEAAKVLDAYFGPEMQNRAWHEASEKEGKTSPSVQPLQDIVQQLQGRPREVLFDELSRPGDDVVELVACRLKGVDGSLLESALSSQTFFLEIEYLVLREGYFLRPGCIVADARGEPLFWSADPAVELFRRLAKPGMYCARVEIPGHLLAPGIIQFNIAVGDSKTGSRGYATASGLLPFEIRDDVTDRLVRGAYRGPLPGLVRPKLEWCTEHGGESAQRTTS
jgi:lipopolysaccharide transport system ATP-binding protein